MTAFPYPSFEYCDVDDDADHPLETASDPKLVSKSLDFQGLVTLVVGNCNRRPCATSEGHESVISTISKYSSKIQPNGTETRFKWNEIVAQFISLVRKTLAPRQLKSAAVVKHPERTVWSKRRGTYKGKNSERPHNINVFANFHAAGATLVGVISRQKKNRTEFYRAVLEKFPDKRTNFSSPFRDLARFAARPTIKNMYSALNMWKTSADIFRSIGYPDTGQLIAISGSSTGTSVASPTDKRFSQKRYYLEQPRQIYHRFQRLSNLAQIRAWPYKWYLGYS